MRTKQDDHWFYLDSPIKNEIIWKCNITSNDVKKLRTDNRYNMFWEILEAWARFNFAIPTEVEDMLNQILWFNSNIKRAGKPMVDKKFIQSDIICVYQLFHETEQRMLLSQEIKDRYGTWLTVLELNSLKSTIPVSWKQNILRAESQVEDMIDQSITNYEKVAGKKITTATYQGLISKIRPTDGCRITWEKDLNITIEVKAWEENLINISKITICSKLRLFQYKILNRCITTNLTVSRWDQNITKNCTFCTEYPETVLHLMVECRKVKNLWKKIERWIAYFLDIRCVFSPAVIILNNYQQARKKLINTIILSTKRFIYVKKCYASVELNFQELIKEWIKTKRVEFLIATENKKTELHNKKWKNFV